jgi:hypothetical protein
MQTEQAREHLNRLAAVLAERGMAVSFSKATEPTLLVENERIANLGDGVSCTSDGVFAWASGNPIASVDEVDNAASKIAYVLRDVAEETP